MASFYAILTFERCRVFDIDSDIESTTEVTIYTRNAFDRDQSNIAPRSLYFQIDLQQFKAALPFPAFFIP